MSSMPNQVVDLDFLLNLINPKKIPTKKIKLFGREWTLICDLNAFAMAKIAGGDSGGLSKFLIDLVAEDEREDFSTALSNAKGLDGTKMGELLTHLIEVAAERPTDEPSPSPRTAKKTASTRKSVVS